MNPLSYERLLDTAQRRELTPTERAELEAWLAAHPELRAAWAEEAALNRLLAAMPAAPLASNFTARVVHAVEGLERDATRERRVRPRWWRSFGLGWRLATAGAALAAILVSVQLRQQAQYRARMAESVAAMSALADLPSVEALADFEVVYHLPSGPMLDEQELAQAFE